MTADLAPVPTMPPPPRVSWSDGVVVLRDERIFGTAEESEALTGQFLARVFRVEGIVSIVVDRARATATLRHEDVAGGRAGLLQRLAVALRDDVGPMVRPPPYVLKDTRETRALYDRGTIPPACQVMHDGPGRLRLRVGTLRGQPALARRAERLLETAPGVHRVSAGPWLGRLLVQYDPAVLPRGRLLERIGETIHGPDVWTRALPEPAALSLTAVNATLGVAALGQFLVPALLPLSAGLLVATNLRTFRTAWLHLRARRCGLPVLYTAIIATTLASGQFVSSALMTWFFRYWHRRARREMATERHRMLDACLPLPGLVRLLSGSGAEVLVEAEQVRPGDRLIVSADEPVPADGLVVHGEAMVDERSLRGTEGASLKRAGDPVLAGSFVLSGELVVSVEHGAGQTRAAAVGRALVAATSPAPGASAPTIQSEKFAERAVGPTLATAGLGLLVGDLAAVGAILRPDYATGPGLGVPLTVLRDVALCARRGVVIRDPSVFERLPGVDLLILDDHPALGRVGLEVSDTRTRADEAAILRYAASAYRHLDDARSVALTDACRDRKIHLLDLDPIDLKGGVTIRHGTRRVKVGPLPGSGRVEDGGPLLVEVDGDPVGVVSFQRATVPEAARVLRRLREDGPSRVALVSERPAREAAALAAALGVNRLRGGLDPDGKAAFARDCRARGVATAFVGDCRRNAGAAAEATVAISVADDGDLERDPGPAAVQVLGVRLDRLEVLWDVALTHADRVRRDHAFVVAPNLLCVAGAFLFGFGGLTAVALSNLGTYGVYSRASADLRASRDADRRRPRRNQGAPA